MVCNAFQSPFHQCFQLLLICRQVARDETSELLIFDFGQPPPTAPASQSLFECHSDIASDQTNPIVNLGAVNNLKEYPTQPLCSKHRRNIAIVEQVRTISLLYSSFLFSRRPLGVGVRVRVRVSRLKLTQEVLDCGCHAHPLINPAIIRA